MPYDPVRHHRRSIRLPGYDYTQAGAYFVTLVTYTRFCWLGKMDGDGILLSQAGQVAEGEWQRLESRFPGVIIDIFVIMPNHIHSIIILPGVLDDVNSENAGTFGGSDAVGARQEKDSKIEIPAFASPLRDTRDPSRETRQPNISSMPHGPRSGELGTIIGAFKSTTARLINGINHTPGAAIWQRNYFEHIIRSEKDLKWTRDYIQNNPLHWSEDEHNS